MSTKEQAHTAGPWSYSHNDFWHKDESNLGQFFVAVPVPNPAAYDSGFGQQIAWIARSPFLGNTESHKAFNAEAEANARLIAAAPGLLAEIQWLRANIREATTSAIESRLDAAIARATGASK